MSETLKGRMAAALRVRRWMPTLIWVVCGLLTAGFMLRYARNVRIADQRGASQYHAVADPVVQFTAPPQGWAVVVRGEVGSDEASTICAAVAQARSAGLTASLLWIDRYGRSVTNACAGVPALTASAPEMQSAASALNNGRLRILVLDEDGRYVFGERDLSNAAKVVPLFAARR